MEEELDDRFQRRLRVNSKRESRPIHCGPKALQVLTEPRGGHDSQGVPSKISDNEIGYDDPLAQADSFLSPENAARFLDVSRKFIYEMIARNEIEAVTVGGRLRRIRISTLEKWLKRSNER